MKALLICPSDRLQVGWLAEYEPLCGLAMAGRTLLEYWLATLALEKVDYALVLADDRAEQIEEIAKGGLPWGLKVEVRRQTQELTPAQALFEYQKDLGATIQNKNIAVLDHFPGLGQYPLFISYGGWFAGLMAWLPRARTPDRVGVREISPGVWAGLQSRISSKAELHAPCWIGEKVVINDQAVIGPNSVIERGCMIDSNARVSASYIGPDTYVGRFSEVHQSIARGSTLINWQSACAIQVPDRFVLSALRQPKTEPRLTAGTQPSTGRRWRSWLSGYKG
jgi:NDP-sugar pyrophosphorylase family protein